MRNSKLLMNLNVGSETKSRQFVKFSQINVDLSHQSAEHRLRMQIRQQTILDHLDVHEFASYEDLGTMLETSTMTVRRYVEALAKNGLVVKSPGGVSQQAMTKSHLYESDILERVREQREEKRAIALAVLPVLEGAQSIFMDGGTTMVEAAKAFSRNLERRNLITNSLLVCGELAAGGKNRVTLLGGDFCAESAAFTGLMTEENAQTHYYDVALFSTKGFIPEEGTYESSQENFRVKLIIAPRAKRVVLLVDHTKFGLRSLRKVLDISAIHCVVTDEKAPAEALRMLERRGIQVVVALSAKRLLAAKSKSKN
jgi:DeoR/GlpR family transcriptional regulator of sugar metabolism